MAGRLAFVFKPHESGLRKVFGELEAEIMEILWRHGRASVAEVLEELKLDRELAYTTVKTVMGRLAEKGYLRRNAEGKAYIYEPVNGRDEFLRQVSEEVLQGLVADFAEPVVAHLVELARGQDSTVLKRLQALIAERRKAGRKP